MYDQTDDLPTPRLVGYNFPRDEYLEYARTGRLLTLRIDTNLNCNLNCMYCAWDSHSQRTETMELPLLLDAIRQAKDLGARSIIIIGGGEPTLYPAFRELVVAIRGFGLIPVMITNGTNLSEELVRFLDDQGCSLSMKLDSFRPEVQDELVGKQGSFGRQRNSLDRVMKIYGPQDRFHSRLALSFVITKLNIVEAESTWRFCRENNIIPNPNIFNSRGRGKIHESRLKPDDEEVDAVLARFKHLDQTVFHVGSAGIAKDEPTCLQHLYSVYMDVSGNISPCPAVHVSDYNVKRSSLESIIGNEYFSKVRATHHHLADGSGVAMINH